MTEKYVVTKTVVDKLGRTFMTIALKETFENVGYIQIRSSKYHEDLKNRLMRAL